jgi:protein involved in plasmid replication-relaxation
MTSRSARPGSVHADRERREGCGIAPRDRALGAPLRDQRRGGPRAGLVPRAPPRCQRVLLRADRGRTTATDLPSGCRERTVRTTDGWIRLDGYGVYLHPGGALNFYLEYDRGTETTRQLANKLAGYLGVARDWTEQGAKHFPSVLIVVPNHRRERVVAATFADALAPSSAQTSSRACPSTSRTKRP